jgi:Fic family protein
LFVTPEITAAEELALARIDEVQRALRFSVAEPRRWMGVLRRTSFARAIQASNSIEGLNVTLEDAVAAVEGEDPFGGGGRGEAWTAVVGYRNAMTYILQLANDPHFSLDLSLIRSLHYMMTSYDLKLNPGRWRRGLIFVRNQRTGENVYEGPDPDEVPALMAKLVEQVNTADRGVPPLIRAAMAHLNLVMVHPFTDGNGRMARALQTLVLSREGILAPQFSSIEEDLGRNTLDYYDVLAEVGGGRWDPRRDARPWIRFTLTAHYRQAQTHLRRAKESEELGRLLEDVVRERGLPDRAVPALFDAAQGRRFRRSSYRGLLEGEEGQVSDALANRDLRALVAAGLLEARGEKRGRYYVAAAPLRAMRDAARRPKGDMDPFAPAA